MSMDQTVRRKPCLSKNSDDSRRHDHNDESVSDDSVGRERDERFNRKGNQGRKEVDEHDDRENEMALPEFSNYEFDQPQQEE